MQKKKRMLDKKTREGFEERKKEMMGEKKSSEQLIGEILGEKENITLEGLHNVYKNLLYLEDTKRIDVVLAVCLSNNLEGIPIWLFLVGASGDMKSVQLNAIEGFQTHYLHKITSKTLVNGNPNKEKYPDLAPKLNGKILVIRDMASLLKLPAMEKGEVWGQLRDLYDGFAGTTSGLGVDAKYSGIKVSLLAGSTPAIDGQILVHQDLGTRELIFRTKGNKNKEKVMEKCIENEEFEEDITNKLKEITLAFLNKTKIKREFIEKEILDEIKKIAIYITYMRATADVDSYSNTLRTSVVIEEPTRIIKQLKRIYVCLMSLAEDYPKNRALEILWHIAKSSAFQTRVDLLDFLVQENQELSTSKIAEYIKMGKGTVQRDLQILWNMGLVNCRKQETSFPDRFYDFWLVNKDHTFIKGYKNNKFSLKRQ